MRRLTLTLTLLLVSASIALAQNRPVSTPPDAARGQAAAQFQQEHGPKWRIAWHERTGTPATLLGGTARSYAGPPEQAGRAFLQAHKKLFGIEDVQRELNVASTNRSENGSIRVRYRQVYMGIPVLYSGYLVAFNQAGAVHYVSGDYYPDLGVDTSPKLQPQDVIEMMRSDLSGASSFKVRQEPVLSIFVDDSREELTTHLAYEARVERRDPLKAYKYVVDAHSGELLQKISLVHEIHAGNTSAEAQASTGFHTVGTARMVNGTGDVYLRIPCTVARPPLRCTGSTMCRLECWRVTTSP